MNNPKPLTFQELANLFKQRGMEILDTDIEKLKHINYYKLKEFAHPLSKTQKINGQITVSYENVSFSEVLMRYYQDKNLRIYLLHAIEKIEVSVKTELSHKLGLKYGPFGYLSFYQWVHRGKYPAFTIEEKQYKFKISLLKSMKRQQSAEFSRKENLNSDGFPSIWLGIDLLTFGELVIILDLLNSSLLSEIASKYNSSSEEFLSWMKCLSFIRNICAHNGNLIDVKLKTKPKYRKTWMAHLFLRTSKDGKQTYPTDRLSVVLCIVIHMVNSINPNYRWKNVNSSIHNLCGQSEERAHLLGFKNLDSANHILKYIKQDNPF